METKIEIVQTFRIVRESPGSAFQAVDSDGFTMARAYSIDELGQELRAMCGETALADCEVRRID